MLANVAVAVQLSTHRAAAKSPESQKCPLTRHDEVAGSFNDAVAGTSDSECLNDDNSVMTVMGKGPIPPRSKGAGCRGAQ